MDIQTLRLTASEYKLTTKKLHSRDHWVLPVVMSVEGVHSGSRGPVLYTADELTKSAKKWNGTPVTIYHPKDESGNYVSANELTQSESIVGVLYNSHMDGEKLKAEAWIDIEVLKEVSIVAHEYIEDGKAIDVSIGAFQEETTEEGEFNEEGYKGIATNIQPDHLALLPNEVGACSWDDGCGIRTNSKNMDIKSKLKNIVVSFLSTFGKKYPTVNEEGLMEQLRDIFNEMNTSNTYYWLEELFDKYVIYSKSENGDMTYYKQDYTIDSDGVLSLTGQVKEVERKTTYETVNNSNVNKSIMTDKATTPCSVNALIANERTNFTEEDRTWLEGLEEEQLKKFVPKEAKAPAANSQDPTETVKDYFQGMSDPEEAIKLFPTTLQDSLRAGHRMHQENRTNLIKEITANSDYEAEDLDTFSDVQLEKLNKAVQASKPADYALNGNGSVVPDEGLTEEIAAMANVSTEQRSNGNPKPE